mmetsp:Transcript_12236/g.28525  ORF Transcript_12236/g.28525 Transcript_12236/m.28525 type:complete len:377 (+) Transcript_12236:93-1223(+)
MTAAQNRVAKQCLKARSRRAFLHGNPKINNAVAKKKEAAQPEANPKWDTNFLNLAHLLATWSKDPTKKEGCVVVGPDREIRSTGFNGLPRGMHDTDERYADAAEKSLLMCHSVENAILHASRIGVSLKGCMVYATEQPGSRCARSLVQVGAEEVVYPSGTPNEAEAGDDILVTEQMLKEAGVRLRRTSLQFCKGFSCDCSVGTPVKSGGSLDRKSELAESSVKQQLPGGSGGGDKWDVRFLELAHLIAQWSKDPSTKVGCIIVGPDREVRSTGFNGFPRGIEDTVERLNDRSVKYPLICHAEENAIMHAARIGVALKGCVAYVTWPPCSRCARSLVQAGVCEVVYPSSVDVPERWAKDFACSTGMMQEAGLKLRQA